MTVPGPTASATTTPDVTATGQGTSLGNRTFYFLAIVAAVQGGHVIEHIVQVLQVFVFGVPEDDALGLLGYVLQFNGREEWLPLGFTCVSLGSLYALIVPLWRVTPAVVPTRAFAV